MKHINAFILLLIASVIYVACGRSDEKNQNKKVEDKKGVAFTDIPSYIGSKSCESCHKKEYDVQLMLNVAE